MTGITAFKLSENEFNLIRKLVKTNAGINLNDSKRPLIISRLSRRLRSLNLNSFTEYIKYLETKDFNKKELQIMIDRITTNETSFFREPYHFDLITEKILPNFNKNVIKVWSAASSSGEEIYSVLITLYEYKDKFNKSLDFNLLASDISTEMNQKVKDGLYNIDDIKTLPIHIKKKYFLRGKGSMAGKVKIKREYRNIINVKNINLITDDLPNEQFDIIFLRNVIIYFDIETKTKLINKLYNYIFPGGYLFLGHSESLFNISNKFKLVGRTVYQKI